MCISLSRSLLSLLTLLVSRERRGPHREERKAHRHVAAELWRKSRRRRQQQWCRAIFNVSQLDQFVRRQGAPLPACLGLPRSRRPPTRARRARPAEPPPGCGRGGDVDPPERVPADAGACGENTRHTRHRDAGACERNRGGAGISFSLCVHSGRTLTSRALRPPGRRRRRPL